MPESPQGRNAEKAAPLVRLVQPESVCGSFFCTREHFPKERKGVPHDAYRKLDGVLARRSAFGRTGYGFGAF